ncbi:hypothetical protein LTR85_002265 [Meristemomyces frigidus]|nr:hypothetical protein LTR85_002265 [Meristemomyces frigidus]
MSYERNRNRARRPLYAPPPGPGSSRQHSLLGYWVPLVVTGTIAIGGLAAWIWSERSEHDEDDYRPDRKPQRPPTGQGAAYPTQGSQPYPGPPQPQQQQHGGGGGGMPAYEDPLPSQSAGPQGMPPPVGGEASSYYGTAQSREQGEHGDHMEGDDQQQTFFGQVRGAMRRTPSPQQFFDHASKQVTAGIAAAGSALGSIMEDPENGHYHETAVRRDAAREEREGFSDHERWSEEADDVGRSSRQRGGAVEAESERRADAARSGREDKGKGRARKAVAVVVSADTNMDGKMDDQDVVYTEHASILSHLPPVHDPSQTDLFVLIYAPGLTALPPLTYQPRPDTDLASNIGSSYSQINTPAQTPGSELQSISPRIDAQSTNTQAPTEAAADFPSPSRQFDALYQQALTLVSHPSQILCFTTPDGYIHILRHLAPWMVYVSDLLAGHEGEAIAQLKGWVGHSVLVVGDDGTGGLADTETEDEGGDGRRHESKWYEHSALVGLGKEVEIVDAARVGDDWVRRVGGRE